MQTLQIHPVKTQEDLRAFVLFPWKVYAGDPHWVPPLLSARSALLDKAKNPFFKHGGADFFLAKRGTEVVGTIAGITNPLHNSFHNDKVGFFGFFEVLDDPQAAEALLGAAENWGRSYGHDVLRGPMQYSVNDECGLLVDGFDDPPRILMTYNPPRYMEYLTKRGFQQAMDLWAHSMEIEKFRGGEKLPEKLVRVVEKIKARRNLRVRKMDMRHFEDEVGRVKKLYNSSWERNWGFVPLTDAEIDKLAKDLRPIIDPDLVFFVEIDGEPVGFSVTLPDLNEPMLHANPKPGTPEWLTLIKFLWNWKVGKRIRWLRVFTLGVRPEFRGLGVEALLCYETAQEALKKGYPNVEMSWVLAVNDAMNRVIRLMGGKVYKTYRIYDKAL